MSLGSGQSARISSQKDALLYVYRRLQEDARDTPALIQDIIRVVAETLSVERVSLWKLDTSKSFLHCECLYIREEGRYESGLVLEAEKYPQYFSALDEECTIDASDAHRDPRTSEFSEGYLTPLGIASMLDTFCLVPEYFRGVLCIEHVGDAREWQEDEISYANSATMQIVHVLSDAHHEDTVHSRKLLEEQLIHVQRIESIGVLAGGIAHDFNNIIAAQMGYTELARTLSRGMLRWRIALRRLTGRASVRSA